MIFKALDMFLGQTVEVEVDRPMHSVHPKHKDMIYPINYGYIPNTESGDGQEVDAYILGPSGPVEKFTGKVIAIIKRIDDNEDKLVVSQKPYDKEAIQAAVDFTEQYFKSYIVME